MTINVKPMMLSWKAELEKSINDLFLSVGWLFADHSLRSQQLANTKQNILFSVSSC